MVIHYNKKTGTIYGTSNGYKIGELTIQPEGIDQKNVAQLVLSREFMKGNPKLIKDLTAQKVVIPDGDETEFEVDETKIQRGKPIKRKLEPEPIEEWLKKFSKRVEGIIEKKVRQVFEEYLENK